MSDQDIQKLRVVIREEVKTELAPINERPARVEKQSDSPDTGLARINDRVHALTVELHQVHVLAPGTHDLSDASVGPNPMNVHTRTRRVWN